MDFERNYNEYCPMMNNMCNNPLQYMQNMPKDMPPYMYGKCMDKMDVNPNMCHKYMNMYDTMPGQYNFRTNMDNMQYAMEPIEKMCGKTYNILIMHVHKTMHKIVRENMGVMPKAISKDKFNKEMNDMLCEVMKKEDEIKKIVVVDRTETSESENTDRAFCPFCNGLLRDTLGILFVTELLKGGCTYCY